MISFFVPGEPRPGGSKSAFVPINKKTGQPYRRPGGSIMVNVTEAGGAKTKAWRTTVSDYASGEMVGKPLFEGPLHLTLDFIVARPKHHFGSRGGKQYLKDNAPIYSTTRPDALKYSRAVEDALTSICYADDAQNAKMSISKKYSNDGRTGCLITISTLS